MNSFDPLLEFTNPKLYAKAVKGGIRYAAKAGVVQAAKSVGQRYSLKAARIKSDIRVSSITADQATLIFKRRPPTLNQFGLSVGKRGGPQPGLGRGKGWGKPKPKGRPITARIFRDGQRQKYPGTFLITGVNGASIPIFVGRNSPLTGSGRSVLNTLFRNSRLTFALFGARFANSSSTASHTT